MHAAVDARFLTHPQAGGFRTYTRELCAALARVGTGCRFTFYVDREPARADDVPGGENVTVRVVDGTRPVVGMPVREQWGLTRAVRRDRPDVLHSLCNTAPLFVPCPFVVTMHDTLWNAPFAGGPLSRRALHGYTRAASRWAARTAAAVCVPSEHVWRCVTRELGVDAGRVFVTPEAAGTAKAENALHRPSGQAINYPSGGPSANRPPGEELALPSAGRRAAPALHLPGNAVPGASTAALRHNDATGRCLALGSADGRKNLPMLARAWAALPDTVKQTHTLVTVWADVEAGEHFRVLCAGLNIAESVSVLPAVTDAELAELYAGADVFLFPSRAEGFGLPALEAMARGCPVVCSDATSLPEVCGDAALLIDPDDVNGWTAAIAAVLTDAGLRDDLRARGQRRAALFSWDECARRTLTAYRFAAGGVL